MDLPDTSETPNVNVILKWWHKTLWSEWDQNDQTTCGGGRANIVNTSQKGVNVNFVLWPRCQNKQTNKKHCSISSKKQIIKKMNHALYGMCAHIAIFITHLMYSDIDHILLPGSLNL